MDSAILTHEEKYIFYELLKTHNKNIGYIFSRFYQGTHNGFAYTDIVPLRDGKQNTFTIIQTDSNNVFGAYTKYKWGTLKHGEWYEDEDCFIVLMRSSKGYSTNLFPITLKRRALQRFDGYLGIFGLRGAIMVPKNCNEVANGTVARGGGDAFDIADNSHLNGGTVRFRVREYEMFECENNLQ